MSRNDARPRAVLTAAWEAGIEVCIPSVVLAETVRGKATDAPVNRVVASVGEVIPAFEEDGRRAGELLGTTGSAATIDALVVAIAIRLGDTVILTADHRDLTNLASSHDRVRIHSF